MKHTDGDEHVHTLNDTHSHTYTYKEGLLHAHTQEETHICIYTHVQNTINTECNPHPMKHTQSRTHTNRMIRTKTHAVKHIKYLPCNQNTHKLLFAVADRDKDLNSWRNVL